MKRVPLRMCIVCRQMLPKQQLVRIVRNNGEICVDTSQKAQARGAYICHKQECASKLIKSKALNRSFKGAVSADVYATVLAHLQKGNGNE